MTELLPCPFCGGTNIIFDETYYCRGCLASGPAIEIPDRISTSDDDDEASRLQMVHKLKSLGAWNKRSRLLETYDRFVSMGKQNEECSEYVISLLDYILGYSQDDPTEDWLKYPYG